MKYYIANNGQPQGPYTIEELIANGITNDTLVWNDTMSGWQQVVTIPEIADAMTNRNSAGIPYSGPTYSGPMEQMPSTWLAQSILATLFCCLPFGIVGIIKASNVESRWRIGDYEGARQASRQARTWTLVSFFIGLGGILLYIIFCVLIFGLGVFGAALN